LTLAHTHGAAADIGQMPPRIVGIPFVTSAEVVYTEDH